MKNGIEDPISHFLELRKDNSSSYDSRRIKVTATTDATSGATETVSIDFRANPAI